MRIITPLAQNTNTTPAAQHGVETARYETTGYAFVQFAHSEPLSEHARNAQCLLGFIAPHISDPEVAETLSAIARRLAAIVEISERPLRLVVMCDDPERYREHELGTDGGSCHTCAMQQEPPAL